MNSTEYAYARIKGELKTICAGEISEKIKSDTSSKDPRKEVLLNYGGSDSFRCCKGHVLIFHNLGDGHFQHMPTGNRQAAINHRHENETTCCPCLNKDYQTHTEALHILKTTIEDPSIQVDFHHFCKAGLHDILNTMPTDTIVKLEERMTGVPGYLSGTIRPDLTVYRNGQRIQILEVRNTHKTNPASRPVEMIELTARHVIKSYNDFVKGGGKNITLKPDTPCDDPCQKCRAIEKLRSPLITWICKVKKERERKEAERKNEERKNEEEKRQKLQQFYQEQADLHWFNIDNTHTRTHAVNSKMSCVPEDVNGELYWSAAELLKAFESKKSTLVEKYGTRVIDTRDVNFKWMWALIQGHSRGAEKVEKATTFRLTRRGDIYLVGTTGEPLKDARGFWWVHVGKDGLVRNRVRAMEATPYRQKVFKVMHDLVRDQDSEFREKANATGMGCDLHVGHSEDPFEALIIEFLFEHGWPEPCLVEDLKIARISPGDYKLDMGTDDESNEIGKMWQEYHRKHAKLFMQSARDNLSDNYNNKRMLWQLEGKLADTDTAPPQKAKAKT